MKPKSPSKSLTTIYRTTWRHYPGTSRFNIPAAKTWISNRN